MEQLDTQKSPKIPWSLEGGGLRGGSGEGGGVWGKPKTAHPGYPDRGVKGPLTQMVHIGPVGDIF